MLAQTYLHSDSCAWENLHCSLSLFYIYIFVAEACISVLINILRFTYEQMRMEKLLPRIVLFSFLWVLFACFLFWSFLVPFNKL